MSTRIPGTLLCFKDREPGGSGVESEGMSVSGSGMQLLRDPKNAPCVPMWPNNRGCSWPLLQPRPHPLGQPREALHKRAESGFYWIKPLLTVLEYDGKNLGIQGGLCQQPVFA